LGKEGLDVEDGRELLNRRFTAKIREKSLNFFHNNYDPVKRTECRKNFIFIEKNYFMGKYRRQVCRIFTKSLQNNKNDRL
jgi:hypothetical protein